MGEFILGLVLRWVHILAAITAVGGTIFLRYALLPAQATMLDERRRELNELIRVRWSRFIMASILFLIISGLYNFLAINSSFKAVGLRLPSWYHMVFGIKVILAFGIFYIASALAGRSPGTARFRENAKFWLTVNFVLGVAVVCLSGALRSTHNSPPVVPAAAPAAAPIDADAPGALER